MRLNTNRIIKMKTPYKQTSKFLSILLLLSIVMVPGLLFAQSDGEQISTKVSGVVLSAATNEPIMAVQIQSLKSLSSATTNQEGKFEIEIQGETEVLMLNSFDFSSREVTVKSGDTDLTIYLYSKTFNNAYGDVNSLIRKQKKSGTPLAINEFQVNETEFISVDNLIQEQLGGEVRSLSRSGNGGQGTSMFIRGFNSLNVNAQPLFVVDGVVWNNHYNQTSINEGFFTNTLADIDLNDIESVTVLKDGTSIYGSKASNGVVLIKTKRATGFPTKINVNVNSGVTEIPTTIPVMNGDQYKVYITEVMGTSGLSASQIDAYEFLQEDPELTFYNKYHNSTNWKDQIYRLGSVNNANINVSGGDERALYFFSIGFYGTNSVIQGNGQTRLNTRFNSDLMLTDAFTLGMNIGFTNTDRDLTDDGVNVATSPTFQALVKAPFLNPYTYTASGTLTTDLEDSDNFGVGNPVAIIENALNTNRHNRLSIGIVPQYEITKNLNVKSQFDYSIGKVIETYYRPILGAPDVYLDGFGYSENVFKSLQSRNISFQNDTRIDYAYKNDGHSVQAVYGWRYINEYFESDYAEGHNSGSDQNRFLLPEEEFKKTDGYNNHVNSISNYLNVSYNYDYKYYVDLSMALDASSRFGAETEGGIKLFGHNWGFFPAVNAAWVMSSEDFMQGISFIDNLKLRASASLTGNDDIMPYAWTTYFESVNYMNYANGLVYGNIGNNKIQWENNVKYNAGIDANLFNDRVGLSFDIYSNTTSNLLYLEQLPEYAGHGQYWKNGGSISNNGFELSVNTKLVDSKNFDWQLGFSVGHYKNNVVELPQGEFKTNVLGATILTAENNPAGLFYGYKTLGVFATTQDALDADLVTISANGDALAYEAGDIHFAEVVEDGIINDQDLQVIGDPNPDIYGTINNRFAYKNFTLDAMFTYSYGNDVYNYLRSQLEAGSQFYNQSSAVLNRWAYEGHQTSQPKAMFNDPVGNARFSDRWVEDGSFLKLKRLTLNYKFNVSGKTIKGLDVSLSAHNLFTITNYLGADPEVSAGNSVLLQGIDTGLLPSSKTYMLGIKLKL